MFSRISFCPRTALVERRISITVKDNMKYLELDCGWRIEEHFGAPRASKLVDADNALNQNLPKLKSRARAGYASLHGWCAQLVCSMALYWASV